MRPSSPHFKRTAFFLLTFTVLLSGIALPGISWMKSRASALSSTAKRPMLAAMQSPAAGQAVILYQNNFETPNVPVQANCATLDARGINFLYGTPQGTFSQVNTVEAVLLKSPQYSNPSGIGGDYAIGMLSTVQNDMLALTFDSQGKRFINVAMDISGLDVPGCGGPFGVAAPQYRMRLVNSPNGVFSFGFGLGDILAQQDVTGVAPPNQYTTNWSHQVVALSTDGSTDGKVTLVWDLLQSGYAVFDNLVIAASDTAGDVGQAGCSTVSQWSAEGNANDTAGLNNGTLKNGATFAAGYTGQAFSLDGNSAYVEVPISRPELNSPTSFTMEAEINPTSLAGNPVVFSKEADVFNRVGLQVLSNGSLCSYMNSSTCSVGSAPGLIANGVFTKVTLLYDGSTHNLVTYVNGSEVSRVNVAAAYNNTAPFNIGWSPLGSGNTHFPGLIDEVKFSGCAQPPAGSCSGAPANGLAAYWPEDGNANDVAGANNPSATNAVTFVPGKLGQGATFGGLGFIDIPDNGSLDNQQFTLSAWARPDGPGPNNDTAGGSVIIQKGLSFPAGATGVSTGLWWSAADNRFMFAIGETASLGVRSTDTFPPGQFYQVTGTYDGTTLRLLVNGQPEGEKAIATTVVYDQTVPWTIGSTAEHIRYVGYPRTWNGIIDDVRIYNRALSAAEINCITSAAPTPPPAAGCTSVPAGQGSRYSAEGNANDSLNGHNGTLENGATFAPGVSGQAFSFNGLNQYVNVPQNCDFAFATQDFTLDTWVNFNQVPAASGSYLPEAIFIGSDTGAGYINKWLFALINGQLTLQVNNTAVGGGSSDFLAPASYSFCPNRWYHLAFTKVGNTYTTYVNGQAIGTDTRTAPVAIGYASGPLTIGQAEGLGYINGLMDEAEILNRGLLASEIANLYTTHVPANNPTSSCGGNPTPPPPPSIGGGLPPDGGIMGPGSGYIPVAPGRFHTTLTGTGHPGCTIQLTVNDPARPVNNTTLTTTVDGAGNWSLGLDLYDCDPEIDIVQICDGVASDPIRRHIYVDGTPPVFTNGGPGDGTDYTGSGGTARIILDGGASDPGQAIHLPPGDGVTYEWHLFGPGGGDTLLGSGGGSYWSFGGGGGILTINLPPGDYFIEEHVCDTAGNCFIKRCHHRVCAHLTVTGGLPGDEGIYGPGDGVTIGKVTRTVTGTGNPGCSVQVAVTDPAHPQLVDNNQTYTVPIDNSGNWSLPLTLDDCDPVVTITQVCDGVSDGGDVIRQHVYVDGTPPTVGLGDGDIYVGTNGTGGIVLDAGAGDAGSHVPNDGLSYSWYIVPGGGTGTPVLLCGGCPGVYTVNEPAGDYYFEVVVTDRAGNKTTKRCHRRVLKRPTAITYTGDVMIANGGVAVLQGVLTDITPPLGATPVPVVGRTVTLTLGSGPGAQTCTGVTDATGFVRCTINPVNQPLGPSGMATDVFAGDDVYLPSNNGAQTLVFAFPSATGNFVIGDLNAQVGNHVTFWGAQWETLNSLSGGPPNASFKGWENQNSTNPPRCGETWTTDPGNSSDPPATIPSYMGVIVSSQISKSGSIITGNIPKIVIVRTDAGYDSNPGHAGTGTVVAVFCQ